MNTVDRAKESCKTSGEAVSDHFVDVNKMIELGKGGKREVDDIMLTRYACYLIARNGDHNTSAMKRKLGIVMLRSQFVTLNKDSLSNQMQ